MNFEQRKSEARELVMEFLSTFAPPRGVDPQGLAEIISNIADAFARKMPTKGEYTEAVQAVFTRIRDTHMSNTWPAQAVFVLAMPSGDAMSRSAAESYRVEDYPEHYAKLMREGQPVPETCLWGTISSQLPRRELERYRNASVISWVETYRSDAQSLMRAQYGNEVNAYFAKEAAQ